MRQLNALIARGWGDVPGPLVQIAETQLGALPHVKALKCTATDSAWVRWFKGVLWLHGVRICA